jgi:hypothetical protein
MASYRAKRKTAAAQTGPSITTGGGATLGTRSPIAGFNNTNDPRLLASNQRAIVQNQGDLLSQSAQQQAQQGEGNYQSTYDFLNPTMSQQALGQGGYTPEEQQQIMDSERLNSISATPEQLQGNFLTPEEQQGIKGNTGSYTDYFNPDQMNQNLTVAQGQQKQAVNDLQSGLKGAIDPAALKQSGAFQQDSENQLNANQGQFGTVLNSVGSNVRGAIDPAVLKQSADAAAKEQLTPEQQQQIITAAGVTAGTKDQAAADAMERQARAAGASPMGVGAYRARMARQQAQDAGTSMTEARARVAESSANLAREAEQQRLSAQQGLTGLQAGTEMQMGQEALQGTEALGAQALGQRNTVEQQRLNAEQSLAGNQLTSAAIGGQAGLQNAETSTGQQQQQGQYAATTGTGIRQSQDVANTTRAGQIAGNRQQTNQGNQGTTYNQGMGVSGAQSGRATTVANQRTGQQTQGINYYTGQENQQNQNAQNAYGRQQQTYGTQAGATNQAAGLGLAASQTPTKTDKILGGVTGALGAAASFLDEGGIVTEPTPAVVGENGPEWIGPAKKASSVLSGALSGFSNQGGKPNPWGQLAQSVGNLGGAYRAYRKQQGDIATSTADPSKKNPGFYGPSNPQGSGPLGPPQAPQPDYADAGGGAPDFMDEGRIVTKPTLAILGERAPEAVVPLGYRARSKARPSTVRAA